MAYLMIEALAPLACGFLATRLSSSSLPLSQQETLSLPGSGRSGWELKNKQ